MNCVKVVLISTYELGRQPFGLASPAAWLRKRGHAGYLPGSFARSVERAGSARSAS